MNKINHNTLLHNANKAANAAAYKQLGDDALQDVASILQKDITPFEMVEDIQALVITWNDERLRLNILGSKQEADYYKNITE